LPTAPPEVKVTVTQGQRKLTAFLRPVPAPRPPTKEELADQKKQCEQNTLKCKGFSHTGCVTQHLSCPRRGEYSRCGRKATHIACLHTACVNVHSITHT